MRVWIVAACLAVALTGCAVEKTQRDRDVEQCAYGAVVPHNITRQVDRRHYINDVAVPACLAAKGYGDAKPDS